jgi:hypothetical protein
MGRSAAYNASIIESNHLVRPFGFTRGPDEKQAIDDRRHSGALVDEKQTTDGKARTQPGVRDFSHRVDVMGYQNPTFLSGKLQNLGVTPRRQAKISKPRKLHCRLAASNTHDDRVIPVVVGQETRAAHRAFAPETALSARSRCTTGLDFARRFDAFDPTAPLVAQGTDGLHPDSPDIRQTSSRRSVVSLPILVDPGGSP